MNQQENQDKESSHDRNVTFLVLCTLGTFFLCIGIAVTLFLFVVIAGIFFIMIFLMIGGLHSDDKEG